MSWLFLILIQTHFAVANTCEGLPVCEDRGEEICHEVAASGNFERGGERVIQFPKESERVQFILRNAKVPEGWEDLEPELEKLKGSRGARMGDLTSAIAKVLRNRHGTTTDRELIDSYMARADLVEKKLVESAYTGSPAWLKLNHSFDRAKELLASLLNAQGMGSGFQKEYTERIMKTKLELGGSKHCNDMPYNAELKFEEGRILVCPGVVDAIQSESAQIFFLAHELSHHLGPGVTSLRQMRGSVEGRSLQEFLVTDKPNCGQFSGLLDRVSSQPQPTVQSYVGPQSRFLECVDVNPNLGGRRSDFEAHIEELLDQPGDRPFRSDRMTSAQLDALFAIEKLVPRLKGLAEHCGLKGRREELKQLALAVSNCGPACWGLSVNTGDEYYSDALAARVLEKHLKSLPDLGSRQRSVDMVTALFCFEESEKTDRFSRWLFRWPAPQHPYMSDRRKISSVAGIRDQIACRPRHLQTFHSCLQR